VFYKDTLSNEDISKGILSIYTSSSFENLFQLTLYKNSKYDYQYQSTNYSIFSSGTWEKGNDLISLTSEVDSNNVPVKFYFDSTNSNPKTQLAIPVNNKESQFPDSRIFINNDSTYCFPYFDTCIGKFAYIKKIRVDFGNGFKTKWLFFEKSNFKHLQIVVPVDYTFEKYISFKGYKFKDNGTTLKPIK